MEYNDLKNEGLPIEERVKHLEREASFVRDYVTDNNILRIVTLFCSISAFVLSVIALIK